jgi:ABC-type multidrug transport system fused ATPase/permease subunit
LQAQLIQNGKSSLKMPKPKNVLDRISFGFVGSLMAQGNAKVLEQEDLWGLPEDQCMKATSIQFKNYFEKEQLKYQARVKQRNNSKNILRNVGSKSSLAEISDSPLIRSLLKIYWEPLLVSGAYKFFNTIVQFFPPLIVAQILKTVDAANLAKGAQLMALQKRGFMLSSSLFLMLGVKTALENQYFFVVTNAGVNVRGTVTSAIFRKSIRLSESSRQNNTVGDIVNYMQLDSNRLEALATSVHIIWDGVFQVVGYTGLLLHFLGPSVFAGIIAMLFIIPTQAYFLKELSALRTEMSGETDKRVCLSNEILMGIRAIKSYSWEKPFKEELSRLRKSELKVLRRSAIVRAALVAVLSAAPSFVAVITLAVYSWLGNSLSPTKVFTALGLFNQLRFPLIFYPMVLNTLADGRISLRRVMKFMNSQEIVPFVQDHCTDPWNAIEVQGAELTWDSASVSNHDDEAQNRSSGDDVTLPTAKAKAKTRESTGTNGTESVAVGTSNSGNSGFLSFPESQEISRGRGSLSIPNLSIRRGELVAVVGGVGSGKSSLLAALLGEMKYQSGKVALQGRVAYVPQESWIPNAILRDVILFGKPYEPKRYAKAIRAAGLEKDLALFDAGDQTEIGEGGVNLSGGQKQRVSLARALYDEADIYFLDDPLSALDAELGSAVFHDYIEDALQGRTRVLVTHQLGVLTNVDRVIIMEATPNDGCRVLDQGTLAELLVRGHDLSKVVKESDVLAEDDGNDDTATHAASVESHQTTENVVPKDGGIKSASSQQADMSDGENSKSRSLGSIEKSTSESESSPTTIFECPECPVGGIVDELESPPLEPSTAGAAESLESHVKVTQNQNPAVSLSSKPQVVKGIQEEALPSLEITLRTKGRLTSAEQRSKGAVKASVYKVYLSAANSPRLLALIVLSYALANFSHIFQQWIVAAWTVDVGHVKRPLSVYLSGMAAVATGVALFNFGRTFLVCLFGSYASSKLHDDFADSVLRAPLSHFESTPSGRIVQQFSKDLDSIDQQLPNALGQVISSSLNIFSSLLAISLITPSFGAVILPVMVIYVAVTNYYRGVARELKRIDSISRSPIYTHFGEALSGLRVVRAFQKQAAYRRIAECRIDDNVSAYYCLKAVDRWLSVRLEILGNTIVFAAALLAVKVASRAGPAGISLINAMSVTSLLNWAVRNGVETESQMNSVDRIMYSTRTTPSEAATEETHIPSHALLATHKPIAGALLSTSDSDLRRAGWPQQGGLLFHNVCMRYRDDFDQVLRGVDLEVQPGTMVGVVGRTGSGKSSLFRALLRLTECEDGKIFLDGVDISAVGLHTLRERISIIPQDPVLFSGTIRFNLDPFHQATDEQLYEILAKSRLLSTIKSLPEGLDFVVSEGGSNFSAGQRQLLCLARALIRRSKLLLLDEATSSVDYETDAIIQRTIREEYGHKGTGGTVIAIAHRLQTIMDADKILVMDTGRVAEFASPRELSADPNSQFSRLLAAENTGDSDGKKEEKQDDSLATENDDFPGVIGKKSDGNIKYENDRENGKRSQNIPTTDQSGAATA